MSDEQWVPGNKSELMSALKREWKRLIDVIAELDEANKTTMPDAGGWSPKDNLAHVTEWMIVLMGYHMDKRPSHEVLRVSEDVVKGWDMEVINPILLERNKDRSMEDVMNWAQSVFDDLIQKLESISFDALLKPRHEDDPQKRPLLMWVLGDSTEHFDEHRRTIEKML